MERQDITVIVPEKPDIEICAEKQFIRVTVPEKPDITITVDWT